MKVILDTNIFLSALLSPGGVADKIYRAWRRNQFILVTSAHQLEELRRASRYPKFREVLHPHEVGTMINTLQRATVLSHLKESDLAIKDPNDVFLWSMAFVSQANFLVTGDARSGLLKMKNTGPTQIMRPAEFVILL
jgi:putative PIN family toxin of toxin-antitoxin system